MVTEEVSPPRLGQEVIQDTNHQREQQEDLSIMKIIYLIFIENVMLNSSWLVNFYYIFQEI